MLRDDGEIIPLREVAGRGSVWAAPLATSKLGARPPTASARLIVLRGRQPRTINFDTLTF